MLKTTSSPRIRLRGRTTCLLNEPSWLNNDILIAAVQGDPDFNILNVVERP